MSKLTIHTDSLNRALVGFDRLFQSMLQHPDSNYPPFNIAKHGENMYSINIAITGFSKHEVSVKLSDNGLVVSGEKHQSDLGDREPITYIYRGLATRDFTRTFVLAEHMKVVNATMSNGILEIIIKREIPVVQPQVIEIIDIESTNK